MLSTISGMNDRFLTSLTWAGSNYSGIFCRVWPRSPLTPSSLLASLRTFIYISSTRCTAVFLIVFWWFIYFCCAPYSGFDGVTITFDRMRADWASQSQFCCSSIKFRPPMPGSDSFEDVWQARFNGSQVGSSGTDG